MSFISGIFEIETQMQKVSHLGHCIVDCPIVRLELFIFTGRKSIYASYTHGRVSTNSIS